MRVPGTEWIYNETDRSTGRAKSKRFPVPLYLDPNDPDQCNYKHGVPGVVGLSSDEPFLVVCLEGRGLPEDYQIQQPPTPDMGGVSARILFDGVSGDFDHGY
jgi:hypothetical protein